jgi:hypothetical protein
VRDYSAQEWRQALTDSGFALERSAASRLRLEFASWIARMATPDVEAGAILALQRRMSKDVIELFDIEADGSFTVDVLMLEARAAQ